MSDKEAVRAALERLPEGATLHEIGEAIAILAAIRQGQADVDEGRTITHEELAKRSASWTTK